MTTTVRKHRGRPFIRRGDDTGSMVMALLVAMVGVLLSALLTPMIVSQIGASRVDTRRVNALAAAQAGIDVALGHIRAANDGAGAGVLATLPCGPLSGSVGVGGTARYQVTIDYLLQDPYGQNSSWIASHRLSCLGTGTFNTPAYALLSAQGTDEPTGSFSSVYTRSLQATYTFVTSNQNIAGGLIHVYKTATSTDLCMDAGTTSPTAGTNVQMQPCDETSNDQRFAYDTNLNIVLVVSRTPTQPLGMCLDAGSPHAAGNLVKFQPCALTTQPRQQWSINDNANFEGTTDGKTLDNYCFNVQSPNTAGSFVILGTGSASKCHQGYDNIQTFQPDATVGAGAAGPTDSQLVSFKEFGRCLDVTEQNVDYGYLIAWPCKQAPDPINVTWNQKWALPTITNGIGTGAITTTQPTRGDFCLRSPGSTAPGNYVQTIACPSGPLPLNMTWTVYTDTGDYQTSYRIMDSSSPTRFCMAATDQDAVPPDLYPKGLEISKIVVAPCNDSTLQKWNAPPNILDSLPLKDIGEK